MQDPITPTFVLIDAKRPSIVIRAYWSDLLTIELGCIQEAA